MVKIYYQKYLSNIYSILFLQGAAFWKIEDNDIMSQKGFDDSKALSSQQREELFNKINETDNLSWLVHVISATEISEKMLRRNPYRFYHKLFIIIKLFNIFYSYLFWLLQSLNAISHDSAINLVKQIEKEGFIVTEVYVDTVGDPEIYEKKLTREFYGKINFTVRKKADSLFKVVSAASICAKVIRDNIGNFILF